MDSLAPPSDDRLRRCRAMSQRGWKASPSIVNEHGPNRDMPQPELAKPIRAGEKRADDSSALRPIDWTNRVGAVEVLWNDRRLGEAIHVRSHRLRRRGKRKKSGGRPRH